MRGCNEHPARRHDTHAIYKICSESTDQISDKVMSETGNGKSGNLFPATMVSDEWLRISAKDWSPPSDSVWATEVSILQYYNILVEAIAYFLASERLF